MIKTSLSEIGHQLPVMEAFYTIQGEGFHQGKAAYFIRLGGCDVGCVWCDVKDSWDASKHPLLSVEAILAGIEKEIPQNAPLPLVVITGGEPLMHQLGPLTSALQQKGFSINMETSGSSPLSGHIDWICLSPKKFKAPLPAILPLAHELKVVVFHPSDFKWAEQHAAQTNANCKLYLQPEWDKKEEILPLIIDYVKQHPRWQLSAQVHKYIHVP
jgi:organic radical activating enzyme